MKDLYKNLINKFPNHNEDKFVFNLDHLPKLESNVVEIKEIIIEKHWHYYNDFHRIEMLDFSAEKEIYSTIGCLILDYLFHKKDIEINLTNENSIIKKIRIGDKSNYFEKHFGLIHENKAFNYWPAEIKHHNPFQDLAIFPNFNLTNDDDKSMITEEDWASRNCLQISGNDEVLATLAELFLNFGHKQNDIDEIALESAVGYGGVSAGSVEVRFWLPGSIGYSLYQ